MCVPEAEAWSWFAPAIVLARVAQLRKFGNLSVKRSRVPVQALLHALGNAARSKTLSRPHARSRPATGTPSMALRFGMSSCSPYPEASRAIAVPLVYSFPQRKCLVKRITPQSRGRNWHRLGDLG